MQHAWSTISLAPGAEVVTHKGTCLQILKQPSLAGKDAAKIQRLNVKRYAASFKNAIHKAASDGRSSTLNTAPMKDSLTIPQAGAMPGSDEGGSVHDDVLAAVNLPQMPLAYTASDALCISMATEQLGLHISHEDDLIHQGGAETPSDS